MLEVNSRIRIPLREFKFSFVRSSGPGGQKVNKTNSCAVLRWNIEASSAVSTALKKRFREKYARRLNDDGELLIRSDRFRDRNLNVADCLEKLKKLVLEASKVPKKRVPTKPTRASKEKRLESKKRQSEKKRNRNWR